MPCLHNASGISESFPDYTIFICKFKIDECFFIQETFLVYMLDTLNKHQLTEMLLTACNYYQLSKTSRHIQKMFHMLK